jgi:hypothetical protein
MSMPEGNALRSQHFRELKWSLQALAIAASDQLKLFPESVVKADDLARDFDYRASVVRGQYDDELSATQIDALTAIEQRFATMSRDGAEFDPDLWTEAALSSSTQWEDIRHLATAALEAFGWPAESPVVRSATG